VDEWVRELSTQQPSLINNDEEQNNDVEIAYPPSPYKEKSHVKTTSNVPDEIVHANNVIQSLNSSTTVAHISGMGLKVIPSMSHLSSLRSVNLSGNYIVQITPGSLPKGLHTLNLSRNKISTIDGLRELTRLRVLDLSYNRISRIGQGLSNCTNIRELYLGGNKISYVEGLHRLLKLTILELSFNKITTVKSLGQLVANYSSLLALNLLGNPIQSNISEDQLKKAVLGLLPKLAFLNKQAINTQKAREVATEAIARAAVGSNGWSARSRKSVKRSQIGSSSSVRGGGSGISVSHKSKHRLRSKSTHQSGLKSRPSTRV
jgi:dynein assembly factor 1